METRLPSLCPAPLWRSTSTSCHQTPWSPGEDFPEHPPAPTLPEPAALRCPWSGEAATQRQAHIWPPRSGFVEQIILKLVSALAVMVP